MKCSTDVLETKIKKGRFNLKTKTRLTLSQKKAKVPTNKKKKNYIKKKPTNKKNYKKKSKSNAFWKLMTYKTLL